MEQPLVTIGQRYAAIHSPEKRITLAVVDEDFVLAVPFEGDDKHWLPESMNGIWIGQTIFLQYWRLI